MYPFHELKWDNHPRKNLSSTLISLCVRKDFLERDYFVINVFDCFNIDQESELDISTAKVLFGSVLSFKPSTRGENKWVRLMKTTDEDCFDPIFYAVTSKRRTEEQRREKQYYFNFYNSEYVESSFDKIGHLEPPSIHNNFAIEVRIFIELLKLDKPNEKDQWLSIIYNAVKDSDILDDYTKTEKEKWIKDEIAKCLLIPSTSYGGKLKD